MGISGAQFKDGDQTALILRGHSIATPGER